jgi:ferrous iron transport protein B
MHKIINIALAGNHNAGKTTLFNAITGARQQTGNWPGVTVEKKEGAVKHNDRQIHIVDLPGTYSLTAYSLEEKIVRSFIIESRPDVVVDVVDSSNIERNLYLAIQLLEMGIKVIIALNMTDVARRRGIRVDENKLSKLLNVPVIHTNGKKGTGINELLNKAIDLAKTGIIPYEPMNVPYGNTVEEEIAKIENRFDKRPAHYDGLSNQWLAVKLLENDKEITKAFSDKSAMNRVLQQVQESRNRINGSFGDTPEFVLTSTRYTFISKIIKQSVQIDKGDRVTVSESIDRVLTHRLFGPMILLATLYLVYMFTFQGSEPLVNSVERLFSWIGGLVEEALPVGPLQSLVVSGIIDGVGSVLGFTPLIAFMFLAITFLEDTGYMARIAFMLDRILHAFGLHGASMLALIVSGGIAGGCAVPGIMATRTMREPKERLVTILVAPLMNCGAKLPIYALLIGAFFPGNKALMMLILTVISWAMALLAAKIIRLTILSGPDAPFILELPPYRVPTIRGLITNTWERTWMYVRKAGTVILPLSIMLWAMMNFPSLPDERSKRFADQEAVITSAFLNTPLVDQMFKSQVDIDNFNKIRRQLETEKYKALESRKSAFYAVAASLNKKLRMPDGKTPATQPSIEYLAEAYLTYMEKMAALNGERQSAHLKNTIGGKIGLSLETIFKPIGFDWKTNVALVGGFAAKEVVVSTLGTAYSLADVDPVMAESLSERLQKEPGWNPVLAFSLIMFVMLYSPCFCTLVMIKKETGKWRWVLFAMFYTTTLAYFLALGIRIVAALLGLGVS